MQTFAIKVVPGSVSRGHFLTNLAVACLCTLSATLGHAQGGADISRPMPIDAVVLNNLGASTNDEAQRKFEANVRRALGLYPGRTYDATEIDLALARLKLGGLVSSVNSDIQYDETGAASLVVSFHPRESQQPVEHWSNQLKLIDDDKQYLKVRVGLKGALALSGNQWFANGDTLTQYNPRGKFSGGRGPNGVVDLAPSVGLAGAIPLGSGENPAYLYGSALYLSTVSIGQDNNRSDSRTTGQWEEAYVGVVDSGVTEAGSIWRANISYGRQPYCIGNGMLVCQIASSGGDRGVDFAWPRWTGNKFLKAQFRLNQTVYEAFSFEANDAPSTETRLTGINLDHDNGRGASMGFTWLKADKGNLKYFLPTGNSYTREGLRVWHARGAWKPEAGQSGPVAKMEFARQTHDKFDMRATGYSAEAGWQFNTPSWRPVVTYRYSSTTGDNPNTARYERWDLLYSGNDIDTWVQGQLMKNIHYNSNVKVHRVLARVTPAPRWRVTAAVSTYRADTLNNIGNVVTNLAGHNLGSELLLVAEHFISRNVYWRFTAASLWPGSGVSRALPRSAEKPWLVGIVQFNVSY